MARQGDVANSINGLTDARSKLTTAVLFTCILFLSVPSAHSAGQRCYVCGPRASQWFANAPPPSCNDFKPAPQFEVDCGTGYDYCAVIKISGASEISRVCTESHEEKGCIPKACAKTKTLYTVCSCNGTLCNTDQMINQPTDNMVPIMITEKPETQKTESATIKIESNMEHPIEHSKEDHSKQEHSTEDHSKEEHPKEDHPKEVPSKEEHAKEEHTKEEHPKEEPSKEEHPETTKMDTRKLDNLNTILNDQAVINKTENKSEKSVPKVTNENKVDTPVAHSLPLPEALGQENKKNNPQQGAPVDDEEDTAEGSGSRIETDNKSHSPTTTHAPKTVVTTTTESTKNQAQTYNTSHYISLIILSLMAFVLV